VTGLEIRRLHEEEIAALQVSIPVWNSTEYAKRLAAQARGELVQLVAWDDGRAIGKAMLLFPAYEEYSTSAEREHCAEIRDVGVVEEARRRGVASALIAAMEGEAAAAGMRRIGLTVAQGEEDAPARALYAKLGYLVAHGPFVTSTNLWADDGSPIPVGAVMAYLVRELPGTA
jgi:GNAT superfamily N-acetyltransferase